MKVSVLLAGLLLVLMASPRAARADDVADATAATFEPATRGAGIAALERIVAARPADAAARHALARALSWDGRLQASLAHYEWLLAHAAPADRHAVELERLQVLLWSGRTADAERGYAVLVAADPTDARAALGLARTRRWQGHPLAALASAERAVDLAPTDGDAREELAEVLLALELPAAAGRVLGAPAAPPALRARGARLRRPRVAASATASSESPGVQRLTPRVRAELQLGGDLRVDVGAGLVRLGSDTVELDYRLAAAGLSWHRPRLVAALRVALYETRGDLLGAADGSVRVRLGDLARVEAGVRRRPLAELADPLAVDVNAFFAAGAGGVIDLEAARRLGADEARLVAQVRAGGAGYLYADARALSLSDGNRAVTASLGAGVDLLRLSGARTDRLALTARVDSYLAAYREATTLYFSPVRHDSHLAGGDVRVNLGRSLSVTAGGGYVRSISESDAAGWAAGAAVELRLGGWKLDARFERRDQLAFQVVRGWLAIAGRL
jgi:tetratricopeptide (TPR) repeat protein